MSGYVAALRGAIEKSTPLLERMTDESTSRRPAPGKWSPREIVGHLIEARLRPRVRHNLDELAWKPVPRDNPATLEYFMEDYVNHLQHHLDQIFRSD
jgi:hypothetical protein